MDFWQYLDRRAQRKARHRHGNGERQSVTAGLFASAGVLLLMAYGDPTLWEKKLFEVILQAIILTGLLNMVSAFHFAANKNSEQATNNTNAFIMALREAMNDKPVDPDAARKALEEEMGNE